MAASGLTPNTRYTLRLGETWNSMPTELVHSVQYDFKPASVDSSQPGQMKLDDNNGVNLYFDSRTEGRHSSPNSTPDPSQFQNFCLWNPNSTLAITIILIRRATFRPVTFIFVYYYQYATSIPVAS